MANKFALSTLLALAAVLVLLELQQVRGQIRSRSEVFGDVVEYLQLLTGEVFKVRTKWPETLKTALEDVTSQLGDWKDTRQDIPAAAGGQPTFLMHR